MLFNCKVCGTKFHCIGEDRKILKPKKCVECGADIINLYKGKFTDDTDLEDFEFEPKVFNCLMRSGIYKWGILKTKNKQELLEIRGFGEGLLFSLMRTLKDLEEDNLIEDDYKSKTQ